MRLKIRPFLHFLVNKRYYKKIEKKYWIECAELDLSKYEILKNNVLNYLELIHVNGFEYRFSTSVNEPCLYSAIYACLILDLFDLLSDDDKLGFKKYFDSFQREDGLFYDERQYTSLYDAGQSWGAYHLVPHIIIAYAAIGSKPKKGFKYLDIYRDRNYVEKWLEQQDWKNSWAVSNAVMNIGVALQYDRDFMGNDSGDGLKCLENWLLDACVDQLPFWHRGGIKSINDLYDAIRGLYHIWPVLEYDSIHVPGTLESIAYLTRAQNKWGGFAKHMISSACEDIDAIDPLIRFAKMNNVDVSDTLHKAANNIFANQNEDGGFCFSRNIKGFMYADCRNMRSKKNESNIFATWFRLVALLEIFDYMEVKKFKGSDVPGYEYWR